MSEKPLVHVAYGPVQLTPGQSEDNAKTKTRESLQIGKLLGAIRRFIVNAVGYGAVAAILVLTWVELTRTPVIIEPISVPQELSKRGVTPEVAAHRLWDEIVSIQQRSETIKAQADLLTTSRQIDFVAPGADLSLQTVTKTLRTLLDLPQTRLGGELVCFDDPCNWGTVHLRLRVITNKGLSFHEFTGDADIPLFEAAAVASLETIDPHTLAYFYFKQKKDKKKASAIALRMLGENHPDSAWAANLMGLMSRGNVKSAEWYEKATKIAPDFPSPWNNWGGVLVKMGKNDEALVKLDKALSLKAEYPQALLAKGRALTKLKRFNDAISSLSAAASLDPENAWPQHYWGEALQAMQHFDEAVEKYERASRLNPALGRPLARLGDTQIELERYDKAAIAYAKAIKANKEFRIYWTDWEKAVDAIADLDQREEIVIETHSLHQERSALRLKLADIRLAARGAVDAFDMYHSAYQLSGNSTRTRVMQHWVDAIIGFATENADRNCRTALGMSEELRHIIADRSNHSQKKQVARMDAALESCVKTQ